VLWQGALGAAYQKQHPTETFLYAQIGGLSAPRTAEFRDQMSRLTIPLEQYNASGVPTLFITSDEDILIWPELSEKVQSKVPNSRLLRVPNAGHSTYFEQPELFNREVRAFLQTHRPR
jgi:pimeloyl-ACP methyl ester carboxylesterase